MNPNNTWNYSFTLNIELGSCNILDTSAYLILLPNSATVSCPSPRCGKVGTSKFMYFNNGNAGQPRYKCGARNTSFTNGGGLSPKRKPLAQDANISEEPSEKTLDKIYSDLLPDTESQICFGIDTIA